MRSLLLLLLLLLRRMATIFRPNTRKWATGKKRKEKKREQPASFSFLSEPALSLLLRLRPHRRHLLLGRVELGIHLPLGVLGRAVPVLADPLLQRAVVQAGTFELLLAAFPEGLEGRLDPSLRVAVDGDLVLVIREAEGVERIVDARGVERGEGPAAAAVVIQL